VITKEIGPKRDDMKMIGPSESSLDIWSECDPGAESKAQSRKCWCDYLMVMEDGKDRPTARGFLVDIQGRLVSMALYRLTGRVPKHLGWC
jgi:hypothetical protein